MEQIKKGIKTAKDFGLTVMMTIMVGYPWEVDSDVEKTYKIAKELLLYKAKAGDNLQASVITPYPGTPLWKQAAIKKWLSIDSKKYEEYDMSKPILKSKINTNFWCKKMWQLHKNPVFILKSGISIKTIDEIKLLLRGLKSLTGHEKDYQKNDLIN